MSRSEPRRSPSAWHRLMPRALCCPPLTSPGTLRSHERRSLRPLFPRWLSRSDGERAGGRLARRARTGATAPSSTSRNGSAPEAPSPDQNLQGFGPMRHTPARRRGQATTLVRLRPRCPSGASRASHAQRTGFGVSSKRAYSPLSIIRDQFCARPARGVNCHKLVTKSRARLYCPSPPGPAAVAPDLASLHAPGVHPS